MGMSNVKKINYIYIKTTGGTITPAAILAPKISPYGLSPKKIGEDIAKVTTKQWNNSKVSVVLMVIKRKVLIKLHPSTSCFILKEISYNINKVFDDLHKEFSKNLSLNQVLNISKLIKNRSYSKTINGTILEVLGTCNSIGCTIDFIKPKVIQKKLK